MDERRYRDEEVARIFESASAPAMARRGAGNADGLTLGELKAIGSEVGIAPDRIEEAARSLRRPDAPKATDFGMPIGVSRVVDLPRALTDREWGALLANVRETFRARGREATYGETRQWSNGNLHAFVEPTATGYRLRITTVKGNGLALNRLGLAGMAIGVFFFASSLATGQPAAEFVSALMLGGGGASALAFNALRLPRWAREREAQMEHIAEQARALVRGAENSSA